MKTRKEIVSHNGFPTISTDLWNKSTLWLVVSCSCALLFVYLLSLKIGMNRLFNIVFQYQIPCVYIVGHHQEKRSKIALISCPETLPLLADQVMLPFQGTIRWNEPPIMGNCVKKTHSHRLTWKWILKKGSRCRKHFRLRTDRTMRAFSKGKYKDSYSKEFSRLW